MSPDPGILDLGGGAREQLRMRRSSTAEQAADVLRDYILSGEIRPGSPLREMHLAGAIGISRNTMREALRILGREGVITQDRHHVATVVEIRARDVREIFAVRHVVEAGAIDLLRRSGAEPDLAPLHAACDRLAAFRDSDPWMAVIDADRDFHVELVRLAANPRLEALYAQLESEVRLCLAFTTRVEVSVGDIEKEHRALLGHLERREFDRFAKLLDETMNDACERVSRVLERNEQQPPPATGNGAEAAER